MVELKKQKITLSLIQQDEWDEYFNKVKVECNNLSNQIVGTYKEIDEMIYELYELTKGEVKLIENK